MLLGKSFNGGPMTIGSLRGEITVKEDNEMIIEVNGVGYRLQVTTSTYETSNKVSQRLSFIYIITFVKMNRLYMDSYQDLSASFLKH